jgi:hypothetical protein
MAEIKQQEIITLRGRLKMGIASGTSINGDDFYRAPLKVTETEKNGQKIENQFDSIMLIFWKKNFDSRSQSVISNLKENQFITVHGNVGGRDNGLLRVVEFETGDNEEDVFI